jgi:hypothetical protein
MRKIIVYLLVISLGLLLKACDTTDPPDNKSLALKLEDVSCTEAWIELTTTNLQLPTTITLKQTNPTGDTKSQILNLNTKDSLLYIDSLLPNQTYRFQAISQSTNQSIKSNEITAATIDTTSHNFTWQNFSFGDYNPSTLFDVAIIDENNILAVGEIYLNDSFGNEDPQPYSIAKWNGNNWEPKKLFYDINLIVTSIRGIIVLSPNNIYLAGGSIFHWDGNSSTVELVYSRLNLPDPNGTIEKIWGNSNSSIYGVGNAGSCVFYNGSSWQIIESGTDVDLLDVWGSPDGSVVWACGYYRDRPGTFLLRSTGGNFEMAYDGTSNEFKILQDTISGAMTSVYTLNEKRIFVCSTSGVYNAASNTNGNGKRLSFTPGQFPGLPNRIRGNGINDFTIAGEYSFIGHYNGYSWKYFDELWTDNTRFWSVTQKNDLIVTVGSKYLLPWYGQAVIYLGRR